MRKITALIGIFILIGMSGCLYRGTAKTTPSTDQTKGKDQENTDVLCQSDIKYIFNLSSVGGSLNQPFAKILPASSVSASVMASNCPGLAVNAPIDVITSSEIERTLASELIINSNSSAEGKLSIQGKNIKSSELESICDSGKIKKFGFSSGEISDSPNSPKQISMVFRQVKLDIDCN